MHQWLWDLLSRRRERQFLYAQKGRARLAFCGNSLRQRDFDDAGARPFAPMLSAGQTLRF